MSILYASNRYLATVKRVIDGDTVELVVDLGLRVSTTVAVRILGIDAPEVVGAEREAGLASKAGLEAILAEAGVVMIVDFQKPKKSFDRWLASIELSINGDVRDLASLMVERGLATWAAS